MLANSFHSCHVQDNRKILMSSAIPTLTYLYLLTQLIYLRSKSPHKGLFLFQQGMKHDQWLCLRYQNPDDGSKFHDREVQKNTQG